MSAADRLLENTARRVAEQLPPLTEEQRTRIAALLAPALEAEATSPRGPSRRARLLTS